jgi:hypothetical protein
MTELEDKITFDVFGEEKRKKRGVLLYPGL